MAISLAVKEELWQEYKSRRDPKIREQLIVDYAPLVKYMAGRLAVSLPPSVEVDDLISYGIFGLIDAIEKFDPGRGVKFQTYALVRIKGAILDGLRAFDWVPNSVRQKAKSIERAYTAVENRLGRSAEDSEVAEELGLGIQEFHQALNDVSSTTLISLDDLWYTDDGEGQSFKAIEMIRDNNSQDPETSAELAELKSTLANAVKFLPDKERMVIALFYYEGLTAKEIATILKVSPSRISQLHSKAILRLRGRLSAHGVALAR